MGREKERKVIVIGGGPSSCSAAIQLVRSNIDVLLITKEVGGLIKNANLVENLLGFPFGISGEEYQELMKRQIERHNIEILLDEVVKIEKENSTFVISTLTSGKFISEYVLVGTGTLPKKLDIFGEEEAFVANKLFYEVFNLKPHLSKNDDVIIIGGGDAAYDYSLNISELVKQIRIVQRSKKSKCLPLLLDRVKRKGNISILYEFTPIEITSYLNKLVLKVENKTNRKIELLTDKILVAIGRQPNIFFISKNLIDWENIRSLDQDLYLIGDVKNDVFRQISIAIGDGIKAAMEITRKERDKIATTW